MTSRAVTAPTIMVTPSSSAEPVAPVRPGFSRSCWVASRPAGRPAEPPDRAAQRTDDGGQQPVGQAQHPEEAGDRAHRDGQQGHRRRHHQPTDHHQGGPGRQQHRRPDCGADPGDRTGGAEPGAAERRDRRHLCGRLGRTAHGQHGEQHAEQGGQRAGERGGQQGEVHRPEVGGAGHR
ncbi:hypothetical protein ACH4E7_12705 [Kitasatospora sp. NPDC018058]|uniref:hypothetical protein n=1 Tax=Kitasatospora sp. NPDC018058 TaxID=3364025 RepID=UPI0037C14921